MLLSAEFRTVPGQSWPSQSQRHDPAKDITQVILTAVKVASQSDQSGGRLAATLPPAEAVTAAPKSGRSQPLGPQLTLHTHSHSQTRSPCWFHPIFPMAVSDLSGWALHSLCDIVLWQIQFSHPGVNLQLSLQLHLSQLQGMFSTWNAFRERSWEWPWPLCHPHPQAVLGSG